MKPVSLPLDLEQFISDEVSRGEFTTREDAIAEAVRQMHEKQQKLEELRAEIQLGIDSLDRGEGIIIRNEEEGRAYLEDIKRRGRERLAKRQETK
jgi:antitoxin ParD1/3/4